MIVPMLCAQSNKTHPDVDTACKLLQQAGAMFEPKLDGVRSLAIMVDGKAELINRRQRDISGRYPEIIEALEKVYVGQTRILDGEVVCLGDNGQPEFSRIHQRDAISPSNTRAAADFRRLYPATYYAFDLLEFEGDSWMNQPYMARRIMLEQEAQQRFEGYGDQLDIVVSDREGVAMLEVARNLGLEGLIAKPPTSRYIPGSRSGGWVKLKVTHTISCAIVGYTPGKGARAGTIGALKLALVDGSTVVEFGECGTGMTVADIAMLKAKIDAGELLVAEVEISNVTKERKPRFPSFKGLRDDVAVTDCTVDQLAAIPVI